tara:strand:- start:115 stop:1221 length:1107 start_codon:yes stop_codon:yes gene_type:complete
MKTKTLILICLFICIVSNAQEFFDAKYVVHSNATDVPLNVLTEEPHNTTSEFIGGVIPVVKVSKKYKVEMPFRVRCYALNKGIEDMKDPRIVKYLKEIELLNTYSDSLVLLKYSNKRSLFKGKETDNYKTKIDEAHLRYKRKINALTLSINNKKCPDGFNKIEGRLSFDRGYLNFTPRKYLVFDTNGAKINAVKSYLNGFHRKNGNGKKESLGLKLNPNSTTLIQHEAYSFGALTLPLKIYLGSNSDSIPKGTNNIITNLNFSLFVGRNWGNHGFNSKGEVVSKRYHSINFLAGASKLALNLSNTDGAVKEAEVLSINTGLAYSFLINKFNIFLGVGVDIPMSSVADDWIFKGQPWLGVGLGYSVFKK